MEPHPSSKSTTALTAMSKVTCTTLACQKVALSTRNEKYNVEREVTVNKVTGPAASIMTDRSTLPCLPYSFQIMMEDHDDLDFLPSLYAEMLSKLAGLYDSVPQKLQIIRGEIVKLTDELVALSQLMDRADLTFDGIKMSFNLLQHRFICLS